MDTLDLTNDVPEEFRSITLAKAMFFKVSSPLDQLNEEEPIQKHLIISTSLGHLTEIQNEKVLRFIKTGWKDVKKILVHHEFRPLQLFVVILRSNDTAYLLSYSTLKVIHEWTDVCDITSDDPDNVGVPSLRLAQTSGIVTTISSFQLSTYLLSGNGENETVERGKQDAAIALAHRLKGGIKHVEQLNSQRRMKECFVAQKLLDIQSHLQGLNVDEDENLMPAITIEDEEDNEIEIPESFSASSPSLEILSVKQKIIHDKWVIGLTVVSKSERTLVCDLNLMLHVSRGTHRLSYRTKVMKVMQRRYPNSPESLEINVKKLDPSILRPTKRATILGICDMPDFTEGSTVVCSGIVTYNCKGLAPESTPTSEPENSKLQQFQMSFTPVELSADNLSIHYVYIESNPLPGGVPFNTVALVGASVYNSFTLCSLVSPITDLIDRLGSKHEMKKVPGVSDLYCLYSDRNHPLRYASVTCSSINANQIEVGLYTRDDNQALVLVHSILALLPSDVYIQPMKNESDNDKDSIRQQLLAKMRETVAYVMEGYETHAKSSKNDSEPGKLKSKFRKTMKIQSEKEEKEFDSDVYNAEREIISARKEDVSFEGNVYKAWRKDLLKCQSEMDELYVSYLK